MTAQTKQAANSGTQATNPVAQSVLTWALSILTVVLTGAIGWITTVNGNPVTDAHALIWLVLCVGCGLVLFCIVLQARSEQRKAARQEERQKILDHMQEQDRKLDAQSQQIKLMTEAMRCDIASNLAHRAEKYLVRGWLTVEEHQSFSDSWGIYEQMGIDGYMRSYMTRLDSLPIRELDDISRHNH